MNEQQQALANAVDEAMGNYVNILVHTVRGSLLFNDVDADTIVFTDDTYQFIFKDALDRATHFLPGMVLGYTTV